MNEMEDISPLPGSVFILSQSEPFNEEMELDYKKLLNWLEFYGIPLYNIHASGHALPFELKRTIEEISPEVVFPIHTNAANLYKRFLSDLRLQVILPEVEGEYIVR
jgi:ribonuclease J